NMCPIASVWDRNNTALLWWRGAYPTAQSFDIAVVGIIDRHSESGGVMTYLDATTDNTFVASNGAPLATSPGVNQWHTQTGAGNGGSVFSSADAVFEDAPLLRTSVTVSDVGAWDIWVNFWGSPGADWRIMAGLVLNWMQVFRQMACKQVEPGSHSSSLV